MEFRDKKVIIFDLDGTLIDSVPDLALAVNFMLTELNHDIFSEDIIREWVGNGAQTLVKRALSGCSTISNTLDIQLFDSALEIFLNFYKNNLSVQTVMYKGVATTLKKLKEYGYILTIVTNKPYDFVEPILKGLNINHFFSLTLGADSLKEKKPSPLPLLHICEAYNINVSQAIMIGDSKNDIVAANNCNMHSIGVTYGYNYGESISTYKPTFIVNNFSHISDVLK